MTWAVVILSPKRAHKEQPNNRLYCCLGIQGHHHQTRSPNPGPSHQPQKHCTIPRSLFSVKCVLLASWLQYGFLLPLCGHGAGGPVNPGCTELRLHTPVRVPLWNLRLQNLVLRTEVHNGTIAGLSVIWSLYVARVSGPTFHNSRVAPG